MGATAIWFSAYSHPWITSWKSEDQNTAIATKRRARSPSKQLRETLLMPKRWTLLAVVRRRDIPIFGTIPMDIFLVPINYNPSVCGLALSSVSISVRDEATYTSLMVGGCPARTVGTTVEPGISTIAGEP